jgi:hypothetical protein
VALHCRRKPRQPAPARRIGENRPIHRAGNAGDCRGDSKDAVLGFGWKPRDPVDDVDGLVRKNRLELVGFMGLTEIKPLLGIPDDLDVLAIIPFDYPAKPVGKGVKNRKPLSEVAHRERFGDPFQ